MLDWIERISERIPSAVVLFLAFCLAVIVASVIASLFGASAIHPATGETVYAVNLLGAEPVRRLLVEMPQTFSSFPPLGTVLTIMIGIGLADRSGLIMASVGSFIRKAQPKILPLAVVFAGIMASIAGDAGFLIIPPLAAALFAAAGRHPVAGIAAAYAGVSGGFSANLLITPIDPLLAGITETAARMLAPDAVVPATANWFMMAALVPLLSIAGALVTTRIVEPRLGPWAPHAECDVPLPADISPAESRALGRTMWALILIVMAVLALVIPQNAVLRDPETGSTAPFFQAIIAIITLALGILGLVYGYAAGTIRSADDAVEMCRKSMADMAIYIVIVFVAAHFLALFNWSNLGVLLAINGGNLLKTSGLGPIPLLVALVLFCGLINLFITSASAKWALLAPIFVPMLMMVGMPPERTQAAFRVGDSFTNVIAPTMVYLPLLLTFALRYQPGFTLGNILAMMVPYSIAIFFVGTGLLILFVLSGLPLGPGLLAGPALAASAL